MGRPGECCQEGDEGASVVGEDKDGGGAAAVALEAGAQSPPAARPRARHRAPLHHRHRRAQQPLPAPCAAPPLSAATGGKRPREGSGRGATAEGVPRGGGEGALPEEPLRAPLHPHTDDRHHLTHTFPISAASTSNLPLLCECELPTEDRQQPTFVKEDSFTTTCTDDDEEY